jgi:amino acid adenylation domain-containing protein
MSDATNKTLGTKALLNIDVGKGDVVPYPVYSPFRHFFYQTVNEHHSAIAIKYDEENITYQQIENLSNQFCHLLTIEGVRKNTRVGVFCNPSKKMIAGVLAILNVGACYVPLDITYPKERLEDIIKDSQVEFILIDAEAPILNTNFCKCITLNNLESRLSSFSTDKVTTEIDPEDIAYIIHTSGSTGKPKGIMVSHRAINNHMLWMKNAFNFNLKDVILFKTPITFDPSIWEILLPFYCGSQLVIASAGAHKNVDLLIHYINHYDITTLQMVPILLQRLLQHEAVASIKSLRRVFVGGESLPQKTKKLFFSKMSSELINLYGPAEATIDITYHQVYSTPKDLSCDIIGKPIANNHLFVLDDENQLCGIEQAGELCITGLSLSSGYCNNPELTSAKFVKNPFLEKQIMYRTGDIVRWLDDNKLEYVGRKDSQIKLNGVRIETEGLINHILQDVNIADCFILKRNNKHGHTYLACYVVPKNERAINFSKIKDSLSQYFPYYMLPRKYYLLSQVPLSPNGKLDLLTLEKIAVASKENHQLQKDEIVIQSKIISIWKKFLNLDEQINLNSNFFELGADSLLALRLMSSLMNEFNIKLQIVDLITSPTLYEQIDLITQKKSMSINTAKPENEFLIRLNRYFPDVPSLFLVHPVGGTLFWYTHLANKLNGKCNVFGIQDPEIMNYDIQFSSIQEMAALYTDKILQINSESPYLIGGASFGATVAIEIANILSRKNKMVKEIFNFDGWAVYPDDLKDEEFFKSLMTQQQKDWLIKFNEANLLFDTDHLFKVQWKRMQLLYEFIIPSFSYKMTLFKAKELIPYFEKMAHPCNYWDRYSKNLQTLLVPGNHETMFSIQNVNELSIAVINLLTQDKNVIRA